MAPAGALIRTGTNRSIPGVTRHGDPSARAG